MSTCWEIISSANTVTKFPVSKEKRTRQCCGGPAISLCSEETRVQPLNGCQSDRNDPVVKTPEREKMITNIFVLEPLPIFGKKPDFFWMILLTSFVLLCDDNWKDFTF